MQKHVNQRMGADVLFALGSLLFVWGYMWFHTGSFFLASFGMFMVVLAFPGARGITHAFGIIWFDFLNTLLVFLLLGIGADNLFVMVDAFKQSAGLQERVDSGTDGEQDSSEKQRRLCSRLTYSLKRAQHAMLTTTCTTAGAFFVNIWSGITPQASFGIFAGTMILLNFVNCAAVFPAAISIHYYYMNNPMSKCFCWWCKFPSRYFSFLCRSTQSDDVSSASDRWSLASYSFQERLYYNKVSPVIIRGRYGFLAINVIIAVVFVIFAAQLEPARSTPNFLPEDDAFQRTLDRLSCKDGVDHCYRGGSADEQTNTYVMVFGVQPEPDREGYTRFDDFSDKCEGGICGEPKFDTSFDLSNPEVQELVRQTCTHAKVAKITVSVLSCVMEDFKAWIQTSKPGKSFPAPKHEFEDLFGEFLNFNEVVDGKTVRPYRTKYLDSRMVALDGARVKYLILGWQSEYTLRNLHPIGEVREVWEKLRDFEGDVTALASKLSGGGGGNPFTCEAKGHELFLVMRMAEEYEQSMYRGILISLAVSFGIMILSTGNFVVAFLALLSLIGVVFTTLGSMWAYGWSVGIIESICAVLAVGFSVDYTVHLGISYIERRPEMGAKYDLGHDRTDRVKHAFFELGTSVFGGAMTTLGASLFLFLCRVQFFSVFGIFVCTVIFWSLEFSHIFFMPALAIAGPVGAFGDVDQIPSLCRKKGSESEASVEASNSPEQKAADVIGVPAPADQSEATPSRKEFTC
jgi:hypothetical protein